MGIHELTEEFTISYCFQHGDTDIHKQRPDPETGSPWACSYWKPDGDPCYVALAIVTEKYPDERLLD